MSSLRRPPGPVRQLSLQQPPRRQQVRRQRSAEDDKPLQIYANPIRTKLCSNKKAESERPKVRVAWGEHHEPDSNNVEVIARQIPGKPRPPTAKAAKLSQRPLISEKASILYSRQELAERLRLAWKQREENKSNIDIFLANNVVEERCDSRLSTCTNVDVPSTPASKEDASSRLQPNLVPDILVNNVPIPLFEQSTPPRRAARFTVPKLVEAPSLPSESIPSIKVDDEGVDSKTETTVPNAMDKTQPEEKADVPPNANVEEEISQLVFFGPEIEANDAIEKEEDKEDEPTEAKVDQTMEQDKGQSMDVNDGGKLCKNVCIESTISINCGSEANAWLPPVSGKQETALRIMSADKELGQASSNAKMKRANFHNCSNKAFIGPVVEKSTRERSIKDGSMEKSRRTSSAPPQRRLTSSGTSGRTQVSIVIDAPAISKLDSPTAESKLHERKETVAQTTCNEASVKTAISNRAIKSAPLKRRAKSGKRRGPGGGGDGSNRDVDEDQDRPRRGVNRGKPTLQAKVPDVVTMVSLVSSADSDSDIDQNSPRDDKLIHELRNKLPTTPIIKTSTSPVIATVRKPIKSVSFQHDSFDEADKEEVAKEGKRLPLYLQQRYPVVCRGNGSALPTPEEAATWRTEAANAFPLQLPTPIHNVEDAPVTDREKRCLAVPIGDIRDKKRKLLRTRSTPPRPVGDERQPVMTDANETRQPVENPMVGKKLNLRQSTPYSGTIVAKVEISPTISGPDMEPDVTTSPSEPQFQTTKERECWHLYRRMCDKGVYVSFDTVLRGMLTPTEYRLRQKELIPQS